MPGKTHCRFLAIAIWAALAVTLAVALPGVSAVVSMEKKSLTTMMRSARGPGRGQKACLNRSLATSGLSGLALIVANQCSKRGIHLILVPPRGAARPGSAAATVTGRTARFKQFFVASTATGPATPIIPAPPSCATAASYAPASVSTNTLPM